MANAKENPKELIEKRTNKRWTDSELKQILRYLMEHQDIERPTARVYYRRLLEETGIDATWDIVKWKVRHLKTTYYKAEAWRKSSGAELLETEQGATAVKAKLRIICRFYKELDSIFGHSTSEQKTSYKCAFSSASSEDTIETQNNFSGFESGDELTMAPIIKSEFVEMDDICIEAPSVQPTFFESFPSPPTLASVTAPQKLGNEIKNNSVPVFTVKPKKIPTTPKNNIEYFSILQANKLEFLKAKLEFEKEKFKMEFGLMEKRFAEEVEERKQRNELKRLELEKQERVEMFQIEMKYKYGANKEI